jgi:polyhydroxyalkanoate synthesis regulator phasin
MVFFIFSVFSNLSKTKIIMRPALIVFLAVLLIILGFSVYFLQKELLSARESIALYEKRSSNLERELVRMGGLYAEEKRVLDEIEQSISELENKIDLETLERYIPKNTWDGIRPVVDRLRAFGKEREKGRFSGGQDD